MVELVLANFVNINSEILVISANLSLLAGSGISGIIHKAVGPQLRALPLFLWGPVFISGQWRQPLILQ